MTDSLHSETQVISCTLYHFWIDAAVPKASKVTYSTPERLGLNHRPAHFAPCSKSRGTQWAASSLLLASHLPQPKVIAKRLMIELLSVRFGDDQSSACLRRLQRLASGHTPLASGHT